MVPRYPLPEASPLSTAVRPAPNDELIDPPVVGRVPRFAERVRLAVVSRPWAQPALLGLLTLYSLWLRTGFLRAWYWVDEGLSVQISGNSLSHIPTLLKQDGSPPLYYVLLHVWMNLFGTSEAATHTFSLIFVVAMVPIGFWLVDGLFGRRAAWFTAVLLAVNPFLTKYAQETRMYAMLALFCLVALAAFLHAFVYGRRGWLPVFGVSLVLMLYTHGWSLFFIAGTLAALVPCWFVTTDRRRFLIDAALVYGLAALAFVPWLPTLLYQTAHTGAPWSLTPTIRDAWVEFSNTVGGDRIVTALFLAAGTGLVNLFRRPKRRDQAAVAVLVTITVVLIGTAWINSHIHPAWQTRYFATLVATLMVLAGLGLARAGQLGVVGLCLVTVLMGNPISRISGYDQSKKANVKGVAAAVAPKLYAGDAIVSIQPEQVPVLAYYLPTGLKYYTSMGPFPDVTIMDWRDVAARLKASSVKTDLLPIVASLKPGQHLVLVSPTQVVSSSDSDLTSYFKDMKALNKQWRQTLDKDPSLKQTFMDPPKGHVPDGVSVQMFIYEKQ
jgi:4-amino-4-deoxy-L-arabinose transferase-like glycosyltransferase